MNRNKLKGKMKEKEITQSVMAKYLGISERTFNTKINKSCFNSNEISIMIKVLDIEDPMSIFFDKNVTLHETGAATPNENKQDSESK